jgi:hypothetical protein
MSVALKGKPVRRRGVVLMLVLGAVALLTVLAVEIASRSQRDTLRARRVERELALERGVSSGVAVAEALLRKRLASATGPKLDVARIEPLEVEPEPGVRVWIRLDDESAKLKLPALRETGANGGTPIEPPAPPTPSSPPTNAPDTPNPQSISTAKQLARLFEALRRAEPDREAFWLDAEARVMKRAGNGRRPETDVEPGGTANTPEPTRSALPPAAPAPLLSLDGLRETGLSREAVFGAWPAELHDRSPRPLALCDVLTLFGDGRINLNAARKPVLFALDERYDEGLVERIVAWREALPPQVPGGNAPAAGFGALRDLERVEGIVQRGQNGQPGTNLLSRIQDRVGVETQTVSARILVRYAGRESDAVAFFELGNSAGDTANSSSSPRTERSVRILAVEELEP